MDGLVAVIFFFFIFFPPPSHLLGRRLVELKGGVKEVAVTKLRRGTSARRH
jgi:hypothetical protein